jgi:hypothetical protein
MNKNLKFQLSLFMLLGCFAACQKKDANPAANTLVSPASTQQQLIGHWQFVQANVTTTQQIKGVVTTSSKPLDMPAATWDFDAAGNLRVRDAMATEAITYSLLDRATVQFSVRGASQVMALRFENNDLILTQHINLRDGSTSSEEVHLTR